MSVFKIQFKYYFLCKNIDFDIKKNFKHFLSYWPDSKHRSKIYSILKQVSNKSFYLYAVSTLIISLFGKETEGHTI